MMKFCPLCGEKWSWVHLYQCAAQDECYVFTADHDLRYNRYVFDICPRLLSGSKVYRDRSGRLWVYDLEISCLEQIEARVVQAYLDWYYELVNGEATKLVSKATEIQEVMRKL